MNRNLFRVKKSNKCMGNKLALTHGKILNPDPLPRKSRNLPERLKQQLKKSNRQNMNEDFFRVEGTSVNYGKMKTTRQSIEPSELLTKLALMNKEKKNQKKKGFETRITLRVISRLKSINQLLFFLLFLSSGVLF